MCVAALTMAAHRHDPATEVEVAGTLAEAEACARARTPDLILLDLMLPDVQGLEGLATIRSVRPRTSVAVVSSRDDPAVIRRAIAMGARGFLSKTAPLSDMVTAIGLLLAGERWLPPALLVPAEPSAEDRAAARVGELSSAQLRVLRAVADGRQNKQIAWDLQLAEPTVKSHLAAIFRKLEVGNRTQAVLALRMFDGGVAEAA